MRRSNKTQLVRKNFVRISVLFDSYTSIEISENPSMTVNSLVSSIGGTLWMSINTIFVIEIFELFYNIIINILVNRKVLII